jgi:hypothetical protein
MTDQIMPLKPKFDYVKARQVRALRTALGQQVKQPVEVTEENNESVVRSWPQQKWIQMTQIETREGMRERFPDFIWEFVEAIPRPSVGDVLLPGKTGGAETTAMKQYEAELAAYNESVGLPKNGGSEGAFPFDVNNKTEETTTKP